MSRFQRGATLIVALAAALALQAPALAAGTLSIMSFNVWVAEGSQAGQNKLAEIMRLGQVSNAAAPDVIGLQEMDNGAGASIAAALGFNYHQQSGGDIQILSRYPIVGVSPANLGVKIALPAGQQIWVFNAHLSAYPYQPYDLRDGVLPKNEAAVIAAANAARGSEVTAYLSDMSAAMASGLPVFFTGDFNEPSHLDWTQAVANSTPRTFDLKVAYPTSKRIVDAGMIDSLRAVRPDPVTDHAYTWTPGYPPPTLDSNEVPDRIDFIYHRGAGVAPVDVKIVGYPDGGPDTDIAIPGYNADHRAVVATYFSPNFTTFGDFTGDGAVTPADWLVLRTNQNADLSGLTPLEAWERGDLNSDLRNDHADFVLFKQTYSNAHGAAAFAALLTAVPEPAAWVLFACVMPLALRRRES